MNTELDNLIGELVMWKGMGESCLEDGYCEEDVNDDFGLITKVGKAYNKHEAWYASITWCDGSGGDQDFFINKNGKIEFYNENMVYPVSENEIA